MIRPADRLALRAERAAVRRLAGQVDAARLALGRTVARDADLNAEVDALLHGLWTARFTGADLPADIDPSLPAVAALLEQTASPQLAARLAQAHELTVGNRLRRRGRGVELRETETRRRRGVYYTPDDVVAWIVSQTLDPLLAPLEDGLRRRGATRRLEQASQLRVFDPACGGGAFLLGALARLTAFYARLATVCDARELRAPGRLTLARNLFGVDLDARALRLAELALLAAVQHEPGESPPLVGGALRQGDHLELDHAAVFPAAFDRDDPGFDVVLGNPPYAPLTDDQRAAAERAGLVSAGAHDIYATFVEGLPRLARRAGRGGLIVPLSLVFSRRTRALREQVLLRSRRRWRLASFDRIPSGLFDAEVRTRTTIALMGPRTRSGGVATARLLRFTAAQRPFVFEGLSFHDAAELHHERLGFPKLGSDLQAEWLRRLQRADRGHLGDGLAPRGEHRLFFKQNCYAFAIVAAELPPAFDDRERPTPQTKYSSLRFSSAAERDAVLAMTAGCWLFWWWLTYGDGFDVTGQLIGAFPADPRRFSADARRGLAALGRKITRRVRKHVAYKRNGGKRIGTFDLRECRALTDQADIIVADELDAADLLADVRALIARTHGAG